MKLLRVIMNRLRRQPPAPVVFISPEQLDKALQPVAAQLADKAAEYAAAAVQCRREAAEHVAATRRHNEARECLQALVNAGIYKLKSRAEMFRSRN